jgi:hypothetical protein
MQARKESGGSNGPCAPAQSVSTANRVREVSQQFAGNSLIEPVDVLREKKLREAQEQARAVEHAQKGLRSYTYCDEFNVKRGTSTPTRKPSGHCDASAATAANSVASEASVSDLVKQFQISKASNSVANPLHAGCEPGASAVVSLSSGHLASDLSNHDSAASAVQMGRTIPVTAPMPSAGEIFVDQPRSSPLLKRSLVAVLSPQYLPQMRATEASLRQCDKSLRLFSAPNEQSCVFNCGDPGCSGVIVLHSKGPGKTLPRKLTCGECSRSR